jgi:leukotriene-A4 hydrolase
MSRVDPHSFFDSTQPRTHHLSLDLAVDFGRRRVSGRVTLDLGGPSSGSLDLDTKGLTITSAATAAGAAIPYALGAEEPILGRRLRLVLPPGTAQVVVGYETGPDAVGLQWLAPEQTAGRRHPFLFTQFQPIHARTMLPCQDTPMVRATYQAAVAVPEALTAVMSAAPAEVGPSAPPSRGAPAAPGRAGPADGAGAVQAGTRVLRFAMPQPVPSYLIALAVGDLAARDVSPRSRVWAEPATVDAAAHEFADIEAMLRAAEGMFGPYEWDRYDMLVLPPAFPYGGMENPRMTFLTPTVLAGDRSLVDVLTHEMAHSWTGNLVTNATMDHFWLNEGFTVWAERRILEALHGEEAAALGWAIGQNALDESLARFPADSPYTVLRTHLEGVDPDDVYSSIPYEKGARFVAVLERAVGRDRFDRFMRRYMDRFRFTSITTEEFVAFLESELPGVAAGVDAEAWLQRPGMPPGAPVFRSERLEELGSLARSWNAGARPDKDAAAAWSANELLLYLQHLPRPLDEFSCRWLDAVLQLTARRNYEVLVEWLTIAAASDYEPVFPRLREVLTTVGRMKYLRPLYGALGAHARTRALARGIYAEAASGYHALSRRVVESVMAQYEGEK